MYRKRLIAFAVTIFTIGIVFGVYLNDNDTLSFSAVFGVLLALSVIFLAVTARPNGKFVSKRMSAVALAVASFCLGVLRVSLYNDASKDVKSFDGESDIAIFEIKEIKENSLDAYVLSSELGVSKNEPVRFYSVNTPDSVFVGDVISVEVTYRYRDSVNYLSNGISLTASGSIVDHQIGEGVFYSIRKSVSENSYKLYENFDSASSISKAVTIGDRSELDSHIFSLYKAVGISHILAISGLHISIIAMALNKVLRIFSVNRTVSAIISSVFVTVYTALVGFGAGAVRAAVMLVIVLLSRLFLRRADGFTTIFIALAILLIINPYSIFSAALQLSFLCSLGIMLSDSLLENFYMYINEKRYNSGSFKRFFYNVLSSVVVPVVYSFAASIFSFPVLFLSFDTVSYASPFINIIAVPLFNWAVELSFLSFLIAPFSLPIASVFAYPAGFLFDFVTDVAQLLYDLDVGIISVHIPLMAIPFAFTLVMIFSLVFLDQSRNKVFAVSSVLFCVSIICCGIYNSYIQKNNAIVEYGNVDGEYVYVSAEGKEVYVDIGGYTSYPEVIFENGSTSLNNYVLLKYDSYSVQRFDYLSGNMKIYSVYLPEPKNATETSYLLNIKELANERNCDIIYFNDFYSYELSKDNSIELFGAFDDISEETLICVDSYGIKIRLFGNGYNNAVNCDIAVAMDEYIIIDDEIICDELYLPDSSDSAENEFSERLRIKINRKERDYLIYGS